MRSFTVALVAGAGVLLASSAFAGPMTNGIHGVNSGAGPEQVRMVCDQYGRCFERRGSRRTHMHSDSYAYEPRPRYQQQRRYHRHDGHNGYHSGPGIGIQVPGVSIGVGGGRW
jgi:hypothetical protein